MYKYTAQAIFQGILNIMYMTCTSCFGTVFVHPHMVPFGIDTCRYFTCKVYKLYKI